MTTPPESFAQRPAPAEPESGIRATERSLGASVRLDTIVKTYGSVVAVDSVSLDIEPGQFVTLLGASGSGKTTLLRVIAGFLEATSGRVVIDDVDISGVPVHKRGLGMVFQNYALFPHLNVSKNIAFPLARRKVPRGERDGMVSRALEAVRLGGYEKRLPSELSGGQQQRVALARAIVGRPRLLLMDEPLGALDRRLRESLQIEIRSLSRDLGLTVINVTHDQEEALTMSDRIALLDNGHLVQYGSPQDLYSHPNSQISAKFLGESNLFRGHIASDGAVLETSHQKGRIRIPRAARDNVGPDGSALVVVRPYAVKIRRPDTATVDGESLLPATVSADIFAGDSRKVLLTGPDGSEIIARLDASEPFAFAPGDAVVLTWEADAAVVLKGEAEQA